MVKVGTSLRFPDFQYNQCNQKLMLQLQRFLISRRTCTIHPDLGRCHFWKYVIIFWSRCVIMVLGLFQIVSGFSNRPSEWDILSLSHHTITLIRTFSMCLLTMLMTFRGLYPRLSCNNRSKRYTGNGRPQLLQVRNEERILQVLCFFYISNFQHCCSVDDKRNNFDKITSRRF